MSIVVLCNADMAERGTARGEQPPETTLECDVRNVQSTIILLTQHAAAPLIVRSSATSFDPYLTFSWSASAHLAGILGRFVDLC